MKKALVQIVGYPIVTVLRLFKPKDMVRHKITVYTTLFGLLYGYNIKAINFILNQLNLESNFGKSNLAKTINNVTGMRCVSVRQTTQSGCFTTPNNGPFGMYPNILASVQDRFLWGQYFQEDKKNQYQIELLASQTYCSADENYVQKINSLPNLNWCIYLIILSIPVTLITPLLILKKYK